MINPDHLALLDQFETNAHEHEKGSLRDHLIGTYELLVEWGNDESVALGGLIHSIYGTQAFRVSSAELASRPRIAEVVGRRAEELAFLFCVSDRGGFIYEADKAAPALWDCVHNHLIPVEQGVVRDLIEIEAANLIEQRHENQPMAPQCVTRLRHMLERAGKYLSIPGRNAFGTMVERTMSISDARR